MSFLYSTSCLYGCQWFFAKKNQPLRPCQICIVIKGHQRTLSFDISHNKTEITKVIPVLNKFNCI